VVRRLDRWSRNQDSCRRRLLRGLGTSPVVRRWRRRRWAIWCGSLLLACRRLGRGVSPSWCMRDIKGDAALETMKEAEEAWKVAERNQETGLLSPCFQLINYLLLRAPVPAFCKRRKIVLTRIHPLHAIRESIVRDQIISSPPRVRKNSMSLYQSHRRSTKYNQTREQHRELRLRSVLSINSQILSSSAVLV
jgi:hypothetical protein